MLAAYLSHQDLLDAILRQPSGGGSVAVGEAGAGVPDEAGVVLCAGVAGKEIHVHKGKPALTITEVRNWLANVSKTKGLPGGVEIAERYKRYVKDLRKIFNQIKHQPKALTLADFSETVEIWLKSAR